MAESTRKRNLLHLGLIALTVLLLWIAFPPADIGALAWLALVPWLILIARTSPRSAAKWSALAGAMLFLTLLHWVRFVDYIGWTSLALYCALYVPAAALGIALLRRKRIPFILSAPLVITTLEFIRAHLMTGFPFYLLGHTQHRHLVMIQIADITGVYGVTCLIAMVNGFIADALTTAREQRKRLIRSGIITVCAAALVIGYGLIRLNAGEDHEGPRVCLVQANIPLSLKHSPSEEETFETLVRHVELSEAAVGKSVDLVIWPETMVPGMLNLAFDGPLMARLMSDPDHVDYAESLRRNRNELLRAIRITGTRMLAGAMSYLPDTNDFYNSACYLSESGELLGRYDKMHLVVFGEYTPLKKVFPFLKAFRPAVMGPDLSAGKLPWLFDLPRRENGTTDRFGVTICYEDAVPSLFRRFVRNGADFMVNMTNDGWFRDSSELDHHLAVCAFRAVENRVPVARCANTGISALIAPDGSVQERITDADGNAREVEGALVGNLQMTSLKSFYTQHGDLFAWLCVAGLVVAITTAAWRKDGSAQEVAGNRPSA